MAVIAKDLDGREFIFDLYPEYFEDIEKWIPLDDLCCELKKGTIRKILGRNIKSPEETVYVELPYFIPNQTVTIKDLFYLSFSSELQEYLKKWKFLEKTEYKIDKVYILGRNHHLYTLKDFPVPDLFWNYGGIKESSINPSPLSDLKDFERFKLRVKTLLEALENKL